MEREVSLFFIILFAVAESGIARNSSTYADENWNPQKPSIRDRAGLANDGSENMSAIGEFTPQPSNENIVRHFLTVSSSAVRDATDGAKENQSESAIHSPSVPGNGSEPEETASAQRFKSSSHLKLHKTGDNKVVIWTTGKDKTRPARNVVGLSQTIEDEPRDVRRRRQRQRSRRIERFLYDSNLRNDRMFSSTNRDSLLYKYFPEKSSYEPGDRFYYNDFGSSERTDEADPLPDILRGNQQNGLRRYQSDPCKKYLEFLKYAFEQLDDAPAKRLYSDDPDEYLYYDESYSKPEPKMLVDSYAADTPPLITPNLAILNSLAVTQSGFVTKDAESVSVRGGPVTDAEKRSSELPGMISSSTTASPVSSSPLSFDVLRHETQGTTPGSQEPNVTESYMDPVLANNSVPQLRISDGITEDCYDKIFPCPDNVNVTYPVNGYCNRFVACEGGKAHPEFCQNGLHFNLIEKQCDLPHNSFCTYSCPTADGFFAIPGDCGGFFRCSNWYPEYRLCPPRMHWDNKAKICAFQELSSCPLQCDAPYQVKPYNGVCNAYVVCTRNIPRYHQCPDGNHFDSELMRCTSELSSNCTDDETYIVRNRGMENGKKTLCADVELNGGGKSRWCQETFGQPKT